MQQQNMTTSPDVAEVRTVTTAAACNQLITEGWILLGVLPLTTVAEMGARQPNEEKESKRIEDTQRYVRRVVGYVVGRRREQRCLKKDPIETILFLSGLMDDSVSEMAWWVLCPQTVSIATDYVEIATGILVTCPSSVNADMFKEGTHPSPPVG